MIDFTTLRNLNIDEGNVVEIKVDGNIVWRRDAKSYKTLNYVGIGDSVAAGALASHSSRNYFNLLADNIGQIYGAENVTRTQLAHGGYTVIDLIDELDKEEDITAITNADLITCSIGGNDMMGGSGVSEDFIGEYLNNGDLSSLKTAMQATLARLNSTDDKENYSYLALLNKLANPTIDTTTHKAKGLNPNAIYVFTTQYHPFKYLHIEGGEDGFFKPLLDSIPNLNLFWGTLDVTHYIKNNFLSTYAVGNFINRANNISGFVGWIISELKTALLASIDTFKKRYPKCKLYVADTHALFDSIPDRNGPGDVHLNDLIHVKFTKGYDLGDVHWGLLWEGSDVLTFWTDLANKYLLNDSFNFEGLAEDLVGQVVDKIILPGVDLHPKDEGYYVLMRSFADTLKENVPKLSALPALHNINFTAGSNGSGTMSNQKVLDITSVGGVIRNIYSMIKPIEFNPIGKYACISWKDQNGRTFASGEAAQITYDSTFTAQWKPAYCYVSLGDSIAAGHTIDSNWEKEYGEQSQFGVNGNKETVIVPNCYTDRTAKLLQELYPDKHVKATSYARSGAVIKHTSPNTRSLLDILYNQLYIDGDHFDSQHAINSLADADLVTVSIGANEILQDALGALPEYAATGNLKPVEASIQEKLDNVAGKNENQPSYVTLFDKLMEINKNAKYVFNTVHSPIKYLHISKGTEAKHYNDGFFGSLLGLIPSNFSMFGINLGDEFKKMLLDSDMATTLFSRMNILSGWSENYINELNDIIRDSVANYNKAHNISNFMVSDVNALFNSIPNRDKPYKTNLHYNDLVSVEFTEGYDMTDFDWGALWDGNIITDAKGNPISNVVCYDATMFWNVLIGAYWPSGSTYPDVNKIFETLFYQVMMKIIIPDVDPHPEVNGHYLIHRVIADVLGLKSLINVDFNSNEQNTSVYTQKVLDTCLGKEVYSITRANEFKPSSNYRFIGWDTSADGGNKYANGAIIRFTANTALYAQWSNHYLISYRHTRHTGWYGDDETGHKECYALYINGVEMPDFGTFASGSVDVYSVPAGSLITVVTSNFNSTEFVYDDVTCNVYWNGQVVRSGYRGVTYQFTLESDLDIDFRWKTSGTLATLDACSWEDCHITTVDASYLNISQPYTLSYAAGQNGKGSMATQKLLRLDSWPVKTVINPLAFTAAETGYYFTGWSGGYSNGQLINVSSNMTLTATWSNMYAINFYKDLNDYARHTVYGTTVDSNTGVQEIYGVEVSYNGGASYTTLSTDYYRGNFSSSGSRHIKTLSVPYGTKIRVWVTYTRGDSYSIPIVGTTVYRYAKTTSHIYVNGALTKADYNPSYVLDVTRHANITFEWALSGTVYVDATANWNCHINY